MIQIGAIGEREGGTFNHMARTWHLARTGKRFFKLNLNNSVFIFIFIVLLVVFLYVSLRRLLTDVHRSK